MNAVDGVLGANSSVVIQSNVKDGSSSTVLRSLDTLAVFITLQPQRTRRSFSRPNVALAIENKTNSFTFIARDQNQSLEVVTREGKLANQIALATLFVPESLLARANDVQVYSYVYRSGLLFLQDFDSQALQSIVMAASVPNRKITALLMRVKSAPVSFGCLNKKVLFCYFHSILAELKTTVTGRAIYG